MVTDQEPASRGVSASFCIPRAAVNALLEAKADAVMIGAYLTLACFTDASGMYSTASIAALHRYMSVNKTRTGRAQRALDALMAIQVKQGSRKRATVTPLIYSRELWTRETGEVPPDGPVQRSAVTYVLPNFGEEQADRVWFNKNLVMGFGAFKQPLKKLKDAGDIAARVLLAMYRDADMTAYGGVPPSAGLWRRYETALAKDYGHVRIIHGQNAGQVSFGNLSKYKGEKDIAEFWQAVAALESHGLVYEVVVVMNRDPVPRELSSGEKYGHVPDDAEPLYELDVRSQHGYKPTGEEGLAGVTARTVGELGHPVASGGEFYGKYAAIVNRGQGAMIVGIYRPRFRVSNPKNAGVKDTWARIRASQREALDLINKLRKSKGLDPMAMPAKPNADSGAPDEASAPEESSLANE
jgi:hypothetical protein